MLDSLVQVFHSTDGTNQLPTLHNVNNILNSYNINPKVMYFDVSVILLLITICKLIFSIFSIRMQMN